MDSSTGRCRPGKDCPGKGQQWKELRPHSHAWLLPRFLQARLHQGLNMQRRLKLSSKCSPWHHTSWRELAASIAQIAPIAVTAMASSRCLQHLSSALRPSCVSLREGPAFRAAAPKLRAQQVHGLQQRAPLSVTAFKEDGRATNSPPGADRKERNLQQTIPPSISSVPMTLNRPLPVDLDRVRQKHRGAAHAQHGWA